MARTGFILRCSECKMENYISKKNKNAQVEKLQIKKYCPKCNGHTKHKEKK